MIDASLFPALLSLLTVARSGSVGAAARLHHRTSSAISQQIRRVETHFGVKLLERACTVIPAERLWVNPDCGLKTRGWPETEQALRHMVQATQVMRERSVA